MKRFGLLGKTLSHSFSPFIHNALCDYEYLLYEKSPQEVTSFLKTNDLDGMNVTIPYKKEAFLACDKHSEIAKRLCNVNTVIKLKDGSLYGHNTDYFGFSYMLQKSQIPVEGKKVLVLGSGGASLTVQAVLTDLKTKSVIVISRTGEDNYENLNRHQDAEVIVNTTPVGMFPKNNEAPLDLKQFPNLIGVLDLIYNPSKTAFLLQAEELGLPHQNGLSMLVAQAKESAELFAESQIADAEIDRVTNELSNQMRNIVLIGMPGCGKTTLGNLIAQRTARPFYDSDEVIEKNLGLTIPQVFEKYGEEFFRREETKVLSELGKLSGCIIATGGGCVTRSHNYPFLHQNGTLIWLKRELKELTTTNRPLSQNGKLEELYRNRAPMYEAFSDFKIELDGKHNETIEKVLELCYEHSCN